MSLKHGDQAGVVNSLTADGKALHKVELASEYFWRIRQYRKTFLQISNFFCGPFAGPSEAVPFHGTSRHGSELYEILRREVNLVALAQQSGEGLSGNSVLFGIGVG